MGSVENGVNDQMFENDEISGTAGTDFANDWEVPHRSTPNTIISKPFNGQNSRFTVFLRT